MDLDLGRIGVWVSPRSVGEESLGEAAALVEQLGYGTFWLGGSPKLSALRPILAATERLLAATGILNVWQNEPQGVAAEHTKLAQEFPGRLLAGIGIGHPEATSEYTRPLSTMNGFLDGLDSAADPLPVEERCLAALGPKMLELSAERSLGAIPYFVPLEHTSYARRHLGPDALLAPEVACLIDTDTARAREKARDYARMYLRLGNYTNNLLRLGFTEQDIAGDGSDRLIDALVPHGGPEEVAAAAQAHLDAGADHVCLQPVGVSGIPREEWTALASALELS
jgi:probable F420-dependent oxidoreductase